MEPAMELGTLWAAAPFHLFNAAFRYQMEFLAPSLKAVGLLQAAEQRRMFEPGNLSQQTLEDYWGLMRMVAEMAHTVQLRRMEAQTRFFLDEMTAATTSGDMSAVPRAMRFLDRELPEAVQKIAPQFGFHFDQGRHPLVAETGRFSLYQILPRDPNTPVQENAKPILIVPPYVLGPDILCFLPGQGKSYVHAFADQGIPTYVKILKNIDDTPAVQTMAMEDDILDTREFCTLIRERHAKSVTLNGYCQGGLITCINLLSGRLDGLVDAHITCVAPLDGTETRDLRDFLEDLPPRFNDLVYGTKILDNGNPVADGDLMSWIYKLKSMDDEDPVVSFYRDLAMFRKQARPGLSDTMAAVLYWLTFQRHDLPMEITKISFASFNRPVDPDGTLPVKAFGRPLNFKRFKEANIPWQICYGEGDNLVDKASALAPEPFTAVEATPFPKGHVAIATHWSNPASAYALHTVFNGGRHRGPVRFHMDLDLPL